MLSFLRARPRIQPLCSSRRHRKTWGRRMATTVAARPPATKERYLKRERLSDTRRRLVWHVRGPSVRVAHAKDGSPHQPHRLGRRRAAAQALGRGPARRVPALPALLQRLKARRQLGQLRVHRHRAPVAQHVFRDPAGLKDDIRQLRKVRKEEETRRPQSESRLALCGVHAVLLKEHVRSRDLCQVHAVLLKTL
jgi:hypothetical protein